MKLTSLNTVSIPTLAALLLLGCSDAKVPEAATYGPNPTLPPLKTETIPTINIAEAKGWPAGVMPKAGDGFFAGLLPVRARFKALGAETAPSTPEEFRELARRETAKWAQVVKFSGAKVD